MQSARYSYQILMKLELSQQIFKKHISNSIKIHLVGAELFHKDRQTEMTMLTDAFRNFTNAPKILYLNHKLYKYYFTWADNNRWPTYVQKDYYNKTSKKEMAGDVILCQPPKTNVLH
jgi:hypothetical protein